MPLSDIANVVIIGGGVVGTAIAAEVSRFYDDVFLLEALPRLGLGTSTRNSGVIHAGIYYQKDSLKAFHCVRGVPMLYEFCAAHGVPHERTGKLIVADSESQLPLLEDLRQRGEGNGVEGLEVVEQRFIRTKEPNIGSPVALWSPNTGIVDAEALVKALARLAQANGAYSLTNTRVIGAEVKDGLALLRTEREEVAARVVINAAGLYADDVARMFGYSEHTIYPCRGEYAELLPHARNFVKGLVYPLPMPTGHGLGVHFTKTTGGALLIGPNAGYITQKDDYENNRTELSVFYESARQMAPSLKIEDVRLSYTGIRPRLVPEHVHSFVDWVITPDPQWASVIHLIGIESPGLTSCLSIAKSVAEMVSQRL
ncbi:MAG: NAD(P)/FAD-dependent oxidoreductase [Acidobacteria bacterium]|jgi:glycerol-3-phosphate dehydrogenase|nr:NAD(P)/FAD-dependent oxidoreductase [Acidobacteriota bacterium]